MEIVNIPLEQGAAIEYNGIGYDLKQAVEYDIPMIIRGATEYHKKAFEKHYVKESITPWQVRFYCSEDGTPEFGLIIYVIDYKRGGPRRTAVGGYYPVYENMLTPHPYQYNLCW